MRGKLAELKLMEKLRELGFFTMRAPGSGSRARRITYPDVVAIKNGKVIFFEVKLRKHRDTIHIDLRKVERLKKVARMAGAELYIAVYVKNEGKWFFFRPEDLEVKKEMDREVVVVSVKKYDSALSLIEIIAPCQDPYNTR